MKNAKEYLKNLFTSYWEYLLIQKACKYKVFDYISQGINTFRDLQQLLGFDSYIFKIFIEALVHKDYLQINNDKLILTEKSELLTDFCSESLKNACILWAEEHLTAWQNMDFTLKTGQSTFENLYGMNFFDFIALNEQKSSIYQKALSEYARDDYKKIAQIHDFSRHKKIVDVGGGLGTLLMYIKNKFEQIECIVFDREEVIKIADDTLKTKIHFMGGDFFQSIPQADGIFLSKILHDWDDEHAFKILQNCYNSLENNGYLYVIEIDAGSVSVPLLNLNMAIICKSYERSLSQYVNLLKKANFIFCEAKKINELYTLIISKK